MRVYAFRGICIDDKRHWNPRFPLLLFFFFFFYQPAAIRIPKAYRFRAISWNAHLERVSSVSRSSKRSLSRPSRRMNFTVGSLVNVPRNWELQFQPKPTPFPPFKNSTYYISTYILYVPNFNFSKKRKRNDEYATSFVQIFPGNK